MAASGAKLRIKDVDKGYKKWLKRFFRAARQKPTLTVGIIGEQGGDEAKDVRTGEASGLTIAEVAAFHEFGLGVPRRSFIADWADENAELHKKQLRKIGQAVSAGKLEAEQALERFGLLCVGQIQKRISAGIPPALQQSTIDAKGSSVPLIDTGQLRSSITFKVDTR